MADVNLVDSDSLKWVQDGANVTGRPERLDDATNVVTAAEVRDSIDNVPMEIMVALSDETSEITVAADVATIRMPRNMTLEEVRINVNTAPTGNDIIVDIYQNGTSVVATERPAILAGEKTSVTSTTPGVVSESSLTNEAEITFSVDQVGSTEPGRGLKATLLGKRV